MEQIMPVCLKCGNICVDGPGGSSCCGAEVGYFSREVELEDGDDDSKS